MEVIELYKKHFDSTFYASVYVGNNKQFELKWVPEEFYHDIFSKGKLSGQTLLDVGCGPTVREVISASAYIPKIYLCDLLENNRNFVKKWLKNEPGCFDYTTEFHHVAKLENKSNIKYLKDRVRAAVKDVIPCNILAENPLHPAPVRQFDIVTSGYCLDCYDNDEIYLKGLSNIAKLIRPGGHLAYVAVLGASMYKPGNVVFPAAHLNEDKLLKMFEKVNLKIIESKIHKCKEKLTIECNYTGVITILASKPEV